MRVFLTIGFILATLPSFGAEFIPQRSWQELSVAEKADLASVRAAALTLDFVGSNCSGTFISRDGHILTASHCIDSALRKAREKKLSQKGQSSKNDFLLIYELKDGTIKSGSVDQFRDDLVSKQANQDRLGLQESDVELLQGLKLEARVNGRLRTLTYLGGGLGDLAPFFQPKKEGTSAGLINEWIKRAKLGYGPAGDFALLKADLVQTPCLPLSKSSAIEDETIHALSATLKEGYSYKDERKGQTAFYSFGPDVTERLSSIRSDLPGPAFRHVKLDGDVGSSGSAAIGADRSVKGVFTQGIDVQKQPFDPAVGPQKDYTLTSYIDIMWIKKLLESKWNLHLPTCD